MLSQLHAIGHGIEQNLHPDRAVAVDPRCMHMALVHVMVASFRASMRPTWKQRNDETSSILAGRRFCLMNAPE